RRRGYDRRCARRRSHGRDRRSEGAAPRAAAADRGQFPGRYRRAPGQLRLRFAGGMDANGDRSAGEQNPLAELSCTERGATAGGQSSLQLHISLFLILIAFFMVLNALSNQEVTRRGAVIESVQNAFRRPLPRAEDLDLLAGRQLDAHMAEFHEALAGIFAAMTEFPGQFGWPGRGL